MSRKKRSRSSFGVFLAAGVIIFLLNILGIDTSDISFEDIESGYTEYIENVDLENINLEDFGGNDVDSGIMQVHFLDVDQGLAILVQLGDRVLVYDGGERDTSSFVVAYLKDQGVTDIDYMISSHYDSDHVSGLIGCLNAFDVKNVIGSDYVHDSNLYTSFMDAVDAEGVKMQYLEVGEQFRMGDAVVTILSPEEIVKDSNSNSVAIKLTYGDCDLIFTGDADYKSEREMIASGIDIDCEVLSVGHHGSATATSEVFLEATTPEYAVISCGEGNSYGHPHKETIQYLNNYGVEILRNDELGTIILETDGTDLWWSN